MLRGEEWEDTEEEFFREIGAIFKVGEGEELRDSYRRGGVNSGEDSEGEDRGVHCVCIWEYIIGL